MELSDPCCGTSLQKGMKIIALIDIITAVIYACSIFILLLVLIFDGSDLVRAADDEQRDKETFEAFFADFMSLGPGVASIILLLFLTLSISYIFLGRYLLDGVKGRSYEKIQLWYTISLTLVIIRLVYYVGGILVSTQFFFVSTFGLLGFAYQVYSLWVASAFKKELKRSHTGETDKLRDSYPTVVTYHHNSSVQ